MNGNSGSERYLLKLKVALATGGLAVTILGAGLLGQATGVLSNDSSLGTTVETSVNRSFDTSIPDDLDLKLEAIPTVKAPTISSASRSGPLAFGRSSG